MLTEILHVLVLAMIVYFVDMFILFQGASTTAHKGLGACDILKFLMVRGMLKPQKLGILACVHCIYQGTHIKRQARAAGTFTMFRAARSLVEEAGLVGLMVAVWALWGSEP